MKPSVPAAPESPHPGIAGGEARDAAGNRSDFGPDEPPPPSSPPAPRPKRFFASLMLALDRAGRDVARIMDGLLVEPTRAPGSEPERGYVGRIPVRNLWLLMPYASELFRSRGKGGAGPEENPDDLPIW